MYNYNGYYGYGSTESNYLHFSQLTQSYWERSLFQRMRTLYDIEGLPQASKDQIQTDKDAFMWGLFQMGFLVMFNTVNYGLTFQPGTPAGVGLQYEPTSMTVTTPYFNFERPLIIGEECNVIKMTPDYQGIWDIISKYAQELLLQEVAIRQSQYNARFAYAIAADNNNQASTIKAMFERVENGEPYIVYNNNLKQKGMQNSEPTVPWAQLDRDLKKNFILPELLEGRRQILEDFYREIGVPLPIDKKERVNVRETEIATAEGYTRRQVWKQCLDESLDRCNRMYGTELRAVFTDFNISDTEGDTSNDVQSTTK